MKKLEDHSKGLTTILVDWSYVENVTPEQAEVDQIRVEHAVWDMCQTTDEDNGQA